MINEGRISDVVSYESIDDERLYDAGDKLLLAGVIDPHVHINEPGRTDWEGFDTATKAALAGGITTVVDMPLNSLPVTTSVEAFKLKLEATKGQLHTNCGFWGGIIPGNEHEIEGLAKAGVLGFKAFLTHSGIDEFPNVTETDLRKAMPLIAGLGLPLLVHCELTDNDHGGNGDPRSYASYLSSRPRRWENEAIALMIRLCREYACRVHIVHLSSAESVQQIEVAKQEGLPLTVETAPHYLYFNAGDIADGQTQFKCAPPIREGSNNEKLWDALRNGVIDFVATDHSPSTPDLKERGSGDFMKAWGGIASIQFSLPALWKAASERGFSIEQVHRWLSVNPSALLSRENTVGRIARGFNADLIVFNDEKQFTVSEKMIFHKHKLTPYLDERLLGVVEQTYLGGTKVYDHGEIIKRNEGKLILKGV